MGVRERLFQEETFVSRSASGQTMAFALACKSLSRCSRIPSAQSCQVGPSLALLSSSPSTALGHETTGTATRANTLRTKNTEALVTTENYLYHWRAEVYKSRMSIPPLSCPWHLLQNYCNFCAFFLIALGGFISCLLLLANCYLLAFPRYKSELRTQQKLLSSYDLFNTKCFAINCCCAGICVKRQSSSYTNFSAKSTFKTPEKQK